MSEFPTAVASRRCRTGQGCSDTAFWIAKRAAFVGVGLALAGDRKHLVKRSLYASAAVQAFVSIWEASHPDEPATLPSSDAALTGKPLPILMTYLVRSCFVAGGLYLSGQRKHLKRDALAGTAMIELAVLNWAAEQNAP